MKQDTEGKGRKSVFPEEAQQLATVVLYSSHAPERALSAFWLLCSTLSALLTPPAPCSVLEQEALHHFWLCSQHFGTKITNLVKTPYPVRADLVNSSLAVRQQCALMAK